MTEYIKNALGAVVTEEESILPTNLPMYLKSGYSFKTLTINGIKCIMAEPYNFSLTAYKKQKDKLAEIFGCNVVLGLKNITPYQRKQLVEEHVPFIVDETQLFLPFLAICLSEKYNKQIVVEKFTPVTQLVFLYWFYKREKLTATELAKKIGYTTMSVNRAYKMLTESGLFHYSTEGRKKYIETNLSDGDILKKAEQYLINPVMAVYRCSYSSFCGLKAGLYALESKSMLDISEKDICFADARSNITAGADETGVTVEGWCYNPKILSDSDTVDDISLILSLKDNPDERVQMAVDELRSKYKW